MWIYTKFGHFSIVADNSAVVTQQWAVRTRSRSHLENLLTAMGKSEAEIDEEIIEHDGRDYRYRVIVDYSGYLRIMDTIRRGVDYDNFKSHLGRTGFLQNEYNYFSYMGAYDASYDNAEPRPYSHVR